MIPVPVDTLWMIAEHEGIEVIWYPGTLYPRGQYCIANGRAFIFLNPAIRENSMRYRCTFAHELGHHFAGVGADGMGGDGRDDERAMRWARDLVLPMRWLRDRITLPAWQIAEEAGVYQHWVEARLNDVVCRHLSE